MAKPKSIAEIAMSLPKQNGMPSDDGGPDTDGLTMAMSDFLDAMDSKDASGMADAFRHAVDICQGGGDAVSSDGE